MLRLALRIAMKDLRIELRTGEVVLTTALFAVLLTVIASLSFYIDPTTSKRVAPGVLWIAIAFSGVLALGRTWARERENDVIRALLAAPIPRSALYLGKALSTLALLIAVEVPLVPLVAMFFQIDITAVAPILACIVFLGTLGFVAAGTLFASMSARTNARELMLSIVLFPLVAPALLASVVATREALLGRDAEVLAWLRILGASDAVFIVAGFWLFDTLMSD